MIELKNLNFSYEVSKIKFDALKDINLSIKKNDIFTIEGPSGSGKSTLLNILGFMETPQDGEMLYEGKNVALLSEKEKNHIRRFDIGFIFQQFYLFPVLTVEENVEYFLIKQKRESLDRKKLVHEALELFGISEFRKKYPSELSGGQRQRVAIARAFAKKPKLIIADEPTASLDHTNASGVVKALKEINRELGATVIIASHDLNVLSEFEKRIRIQDGRLL